MKEVIKSLETIVASTYGLTLKTQNYHWNVTGPNFKPLHELFGVQYEEMQTAIDDLAERIRSLGSKVDATFMAFDKLSKVKAGDNKINASAMLKDLAASHKIVIKLLKDGVVLAQKNHDEATADMLISRLEVHDKNLWMIEASL